MRSLSSTSRSSRPFLSALLRLRFFSLAQSDTGVARDYWEFISDALQYFVTVPRIVIKTGLVGPDGREEELSEYICDTPGCPNIATQVVGCVPQLGIFSVACQEHASSKKR